jgi:hypothetical protein
MAKSNWFSQAFGAVADEVGAAIADVRSKLIDEAWFGRRAGAASEHHLSHQHEAGERDIHGNGESVLDQLYARDPSQFVQPQERDTPEQDHDIDR